MTQYALPVYNYEEMDNMPNGDVQFVMQLCLRLEGNQYPMPKTNKETTGKII